MKKIFCIKLIAFTAILLLFATDCKKDESAGKIPSCVTQAATNVYAKCATLNGTITYNNSMEVDPLNTELQQVMAVLRKCFNYAEANANTNVSADIRGLTPGTTYHFRIKAGNILGTDYGDDMSFSTLPPAADHTGETGTVEDADGNVYQTIGIGSQIWMAENLKTTRYRNGDLIGTTTPSTFDISGESTPKYQWAYDGDESNVDHIWKIIYLACC